MVVVGTGMAGARVVEDVLAREPDRFDIRMFGAEPHATYNRILLSSVLGGFKDADQLWLKSREWYEDHGVVVHAGVRAEHIDRDRRVVSGGAGKVEEPYDTLVLATGSRPFVPPLNGARQRGVFVFRTLEDCQQIAAYARECDRAVVIGGGLLGLKAGAACSATTSKSPSWKSPPISWCSNSTPLAAPCSSACSKTWACKSCSKKQPRACSATAR